MSVVARIKRALMSDEQASELGHAVCRQAENLGRQMEILDRRSLTIGAYLRGEAKGPDFADAERLLSEVDKVLAGGDVMFQMMSDTHSLQSWRDQLAASIERARKYGGGASNLDPCRSAR